MISAALIDLRADPTRTVVSPRNDMGAGDYTYHLASSRKRVAIGQRVAQSRPPLIFRFNASAIEMALLLLDAEARGSKMIMEVHDELVLPLACLIIIDNFIKRIYNY